MTYSIFSSDLKCCYEVGYSDALDITVINVMGTYIWINLEFLSCLDE